METAEEPIPLPIPAIPPVAAGLEKTQDEEFHLSEVVTVAAAHGAHDTYFSFLPTILPLLIQKLSLSTAQAGWLTVFSQAPNLLQPVIGNLADRKNLKALVILAPTLSGFFVTMVGIAPTYSAAALLLLLAGFSTAGFHSIAPAMVSARSGKKVGRGMGFFMVGGEFGFGAGPLLVVVTIGVLTIKGLPWLMSLGMLASVILFFRLRQVSTVRPAQAEAGQSAWKAISAMRSLMLPIMAITFINGFLIANVVNYLPTFMSREGAAFAIAGISLTVVELGGTVGVFLMGMYSDRLGHRTIALFGTVASAALALAFLNTQGWLQMVFLAGIGLTAFISNPAFLAMIQTRFTENRALANGVYMSTSFILRSIVVVLVGMLADRYGMRPVFVGSALVALTSVPVILMLPEK